MQTTAKIFQPSFIFQLAIEFLMMWYLDAIQSIFRSIFAMIVMVSDMFALPVLFKTLLLPYRVENRKGFVAVAIGIGFVVRLASIFSCLFIMALIAIVGLMASLIWVFIPILFLYLLLAPIFK